MIHEAIQNAINESTDYLNISIKNTNKVIKEKNVHEFLNQEVIAFGKYDGTKLSIIRTETPWDEDKWYKNFIVSYKGNILYGTEYIDADDSQDVLDKTIGVSQYKSIFNHISENWKDWKSLPIKTEFFFEFLMNKPTLTRQYTKLRQMIFIGYSSISSYKENNGKISTSTNGFFMDNREKFAKIFKVNLPEELFNGKLNNLPNGLNTRSKEYFKDYNEKISNAESDLEKWEIIREFFLNIPSLYGSQKEEGVVFHLSKPISGTQILKIVQDDQYDKELRGSNKSKFKMDFEDEDQYWLNIREKAKEIIGMVDYTKPLYRTLKDVSKIVYKDWKVDISHSKKTEQNIRDDLQLTIKSMLIRLLPGNNGALLVGKFRVVTNGHMKMFKEALKGSDKLVISIVSNKETKRTLDLRIKMVKSAVPDAEIITTTSGNLLTMMNKTNTNINMVFAGSDRVESYKNQLKRNPDVMVKEIKRTDEDESATKVIRNLSDLKYFKKNTPKSTHKFYEELIKTYGKNENFRKQGNKMIREMLSELEKNEDFGSKKIEDNIAFYIEKSTMYLEDVKNTSKSLKEGRRLRKELDKIIKILNNEIDLVSKGEYS